ncbi:MAG: NAD-dependent epimerase/dehydratase family protein [Acidimicrobiia bacterium]
MSTILLSGVGNLGGWALELLARTPGVERIVTLKRGPWNGPSLTSLAMIGSTFQGHTKSFQHHQLDLADEDAVVRVLREVRPDAILHSATVQSPRRMMQAEIDPGLRRVLATATFGMWLPWHLLPATRLIAAVEKAGISTHVVNAAFPDVVNVALWRSLGHGPSAGAGNVEVCAAQVLRHVMEVTGAPAGDIEVSLVGSHALLTHGPADVPHHFRLRVNGTDVTTEFDLEKIMSSWPEEIDWRKVDVFSLFAASAVKNVMALIGEEEVRTHVTAPLGLPGGYPARIRHGQIQLELPDDLSREEAVALNEEALRWDGIDRIETDGTVVYTADARAAMSELGIPSDPVAPTELPERSAILKDFYHRLTVNKENHA